jgi:hypothetical protein
MRSGDHDRIRVVAEAPTQEIYCGLSPRLSVKVMVSQASCSLFQAMDFSKAVLPLSLFIFITPNKQIVELKSIVGLLQAVPCHRNRSEN